MAKLLILVTLTFSIVLAQQGSKAASSVAFGGVAISTAGGPNIAKGGVAASSGSEKKVSTG